MYRTISKDIRKVENFARYLGYKVRYLKPDNQEDAGIFDYDKQEIVIYTDSRTTKTDILLVLMHELGHGLDYIDLGKPDPSTLRGEFSTPMRKMTKKQRRRLLELEKKAIDYMLTIWYGLRLKLPRWRVTAEQEYDRWMYTRFAKDGLFPTSGESASQREKILATHKTGSTS
jgi:hypothetical protein